MDTGDRILRTISEKLSEYESRLELLRWIDLSTVDDSSPIDGFLIDLSRRLKDVVHLRTVAAYAMANDTWVAVTAHDDSLVDVPDGIAETTHDDRCHVIESEDRGKIHLYAAIRAKEAPPVLLVLTDDYFGRPISVLHDEDFQHFIETLVGQVGVYLENKTHRKLERHQEGIVDIFFQTMIRDDSAEAVRPWGEIARLFAGFVPDWGPFQIEPTPLVQILSYRRKMPNVLELQASHLGGDDPLSAEIGKLLRREDTICGYFLELDEMGGLDDDYLYVDPTQDPYGKRYTSLLYDALPRSELVIPIRYARGGQGGDKRGELVGLMNLEHPRADVFLDYHILMLQEGARRLAPMVKALLVEEDSP